MPAKSRGGGRKPASAAAAAGSSKKGRQQSSSKIRSKSGYQSDHDGDCAGSGSESDSEEIGSEGDGCSRKGCKKGSKCGSKRGSSSSGKKKGEGAGGWGGRRRPKYNWFKMQKMLQEGGEEQVRRDQLLTIVCLLYTVYRTHTQAITVCGCRRANGGLHEVVWHLLPCQVDVAEAEVLM
jgi:hypothetical protein